MKTTSQLREEARQAVHAYKVRWLASHEYYLGIGLDFQKTLLELQRDISVVEFADEIRKERELLASNPHLSNS